jgi:hypothetical protein
MADTGVNLMDLRPHIVIDAIIRLAIVALVTYVCFHTDLFKGL